MITTIRTIAITIAVAGWTFAACDAHASDCQHSPAVAHAEATLLEAQARLAETDFDPPSMAQTRATLEALVASALEERRAALAVCAPSQPPAYASPFEDDPWEPIDQGAPQVDRTVDRMVDSPEPDPAWCAVMGCETSADAAVLP